MKSCGDFNIGSGEVVVAKIESCSHDSPSVEGHSPASGPRKLGDQTMSVEAAEEPAHFGASLFPTLTKR